MEGSIELNPNSISSQRITKSIYCDTILSLHISLFMAEVLCSGSCMACTMQEMGIKRVGKQSKFAKPK
jgi:hypothetical protein